jgi:hypothetical protein
VLAALEGERPRVVIVTGVGSVAVDYVPAQLREAEADYDLDVIRVPMDQPRRPGAALSSHPSRLVAGAGQLVRPEGVGPGGLPEYSAGCSDHVVPPGLLTEGDGVRLEPLSVFP